MLAPGSARVNRGLSQRSLRLFTRLGQPENPLRLQYLLEAGLVRNDERGTVDLYEVSAIEISEEAGDGFPGQINRLADFFVCQSQRRVGPGVTCRADLPVLRGQIQQ